MLSERAAVASEHPLASLAGYDVLRNGGNAFDAAVATSFALAVTFHPAGGLGGDFFGMFYEAKTGKIHSLNGSGWSPSGLTRDVLASRGHTAPPQFGPLATVVPGFVSGVWEFHKKLGTLAFKDLLRSSTELASRGFPAGEGLCKDVTKAYPEISPEAKEIFAPTGRPPVTGDWIRQEALARVISEIAESGPEAFYSGWPAEKMASELRSRGGPFNLEDFSDYRAEWVSPLEFDYRGTTVHEFPPNSMGATSLLILKVLSQSDLSEAGPLSAKRIELTMNAVFPAYARRDKMLGDPRFESFDFDAFMSEPDSHAPPPTRIRSADTTAFSVADAEGNIVSAILSLFDRFGSRIFVPECGIIMNNRASAFGPSGPNRVEPRKRPLHTLSCMILEKKDRPYLAIGAAGGDYRPMQHALFVTNAVDYAMPAEVNVAYPRFLWGGGRKLLVEQGYELPSDARFEVQNLPLPGRTGVCQAVELGDRYRKAVCDVRGDGVPAGF